jgi:glutaconyl-CoA/methylmalonyl-CoA decarboxylase subunit delta
MLLPLLAVDRQVILDGLLISIVGYLVVLSTLALLYYVFNNLPRLLHLPVRAKLRKQGHEVKKVEDLAIPGDVGAAIAAALFMYFNEMHDEEQTTMTIKKVSKTYSPWSSKIFGVSRQIKK